MNGKVLEYATPPIARRFAWRRWLLLLLIASAVAVVYWRTTDWWAYVDEGNGKRWPKFKMPGWCQFIESSVVGVACTAVLLICEYLARRIGRHITKRGN